jgi:hypothetical protein
LSDASPAPPREAPPRWSRRVAWLVALWAAGVAALALVAWLVHAVMGWAGWVR